MDLRRLAKIIIGGLEEMYLHCIHRCYKFSTGHRVQLDIRRWWCSSVATYSTSEIKFEKTRKIHGSISEKTAGSSWSDIAGFTDAVFTQRFNEESHGWLRESITSIKVQRSLSETLIRIFINDPRSHWSNLSKSRTFRSNGTRWVFQTTCMLTMCLS